MQKINILFWTIIALFHLSQSVFSQATDSLHSENIVKQLARAYNQFDYGKSAELLNTAFNSIDQLSTKNRVQVYKYAAFIAFQNSNTTLAINHFWNLLEIDPNYVLDPVTTSPKLLTLFQKTKIEFLQDLNRRLELIQGKKSEGNVTWRALVFPGWEQWHRGYRTRGILLSSAGLASIGGLIYSAIMTKQKKNKYLNAEQPDVVAKLYDEYNTHYQRQYYFGYTFVALWAISQIDLAFWSHPKISLKVSFFSPEHKNIYPVASLKIKLFATN